MKHTKECIKAQEQYEQIVKDFAASFPNYCRTCNGWGGHVARGSSVPYGSTWVSLPDEVDPCVDCQQEGLCPICSSEMNVEDDEPCPECGWQWGDEGLLEPPGCICPDEEIEW